MKLNILSLIVFSTLILATGLVSAADTYGIITSTYSLIFLAIIMSFTYIFITGIGHTVSLDYDLKDLSIAVGFFFGLIAFLYLEKTFLADTQLTDVLDTLVSVGVWTNLIVPCIEFILSLTIGSYMAKRVKGVDY